MNLHAWLKSENENVFWRAFRPCACTEKIEQLQMTDHDSIN
jgi:hypothetical protein